MSDADSARRKIDQYLKARFFRVQGFCNIIDAKLLRSIIVFQIASGITGSLVEIGVWHGKSFFILAKGAMPNEKALAADLFSTRPLAKGERQQIDEFADNCNSNDVAVTENELLRGDSQGLKSADIFNRCGSARLFHVDGAHDYAHAMSDFNLAREVLAEHGVIVIDDAFNPHHPEVAAAVCDWLRANPQFVPWAVSPQKMYVARVEDKQLYESMVLREFRRESGLFARMFGSRFVVLDARTIDKLAERVKRAILTPRQVKIPRAIDIVAAGGPRAGDRS